VAPPGQPGRPTRQSSSTGSITLEWEPAFEDGGSSITQYQLYYDALEAAGTSGTENWQEYTLTTPLSLSQAVTGLTATQQYKFKVRARSGSTLAGDYSPISVHYPASVPGAIAFIEADTEQNGTNITLHWTQPTSSDLPVLGYKVYTNEGYRTYDFVLQENVQSPDVTELTVTELTPGVEYAFEISAYSAVGESTISSATYVYAMTKPGTPEAPVWVTSAQVDATTAKITLRWEPVLDTGYVPLTGYQLWQHEVGSAAAPVMACGGSGDPTLLSCEVTGLTLDADYEFWVTALNTLESEPSDTTTLTAAGLPGIPGSIIQVFRTPKSISLSWTAPSDDGGSAVLAYTIVEEVYYEALGKVTDQVRYFGIETSVLLDGLSSGNVYRFKVKCTNKVGDSDYSDIYAFDILDAPNAPVNVKVKSYSETSVTLVWDAPLSSGGATILTYTVYRQQLSDSTSSLVSIGSVATGIFTYIDSTVSNGERYAYAIAASNSYDEGETSPTVTVKTIAVPSGMTAPQFVSSSPTSISVTWAAPTSDGSAQIEYYILLFKPEFNNTYTEVYRGLSRFYSVSNVNAGFTYRFKVKSVNEAGGSEDSPALGPIYAAKAPDTPINLRLITRSNSLIKIRWDAPTSTGGLPITSYKVYKAVGSGSFELDDGTSSILDFSEKTFTLNTITAGSWYSFKISALNAIGESLKTGPLKIIAADLPEKPTNPPIIESKTTSSVTISLTTMADVTGYIVMIDNGLGDDDSFKVVSDSLLTSLTINGLVAGRTYRIKYSGRNKVYDTGNMFEGDELMFSDSAKFAAVESPTKPRNLRQSSLCYRTSIVIEWDAPISTGGSPVTGYNIKLNDGTAIVVGDIRSYVFTNLTPGAEYDINIESVTLFGSSGYLGMSLTAYPGVVPTSPAPVTFTSVTRHSILLSWDALLDGDTGGTSTDPIAITTYNLYMKKSSESEYKLLATTDGSTTTFTASYLKSGVLYKFKVSATNVIGESILSSSNEMMPGTAPSSPGKPSAVVFNPTEVHFSWQEPFDNGGAPITSYTLTITELPAATVTKEIIVVGDEEYIWDGEADVSAGIVAGTEYQVTIRANNFVTNYFASKTGASSAITYFSTSVLPTTVPELLASSVTRSSATVSWTALSTSEEEGYSTTDVVYILEADDGKGGEFGVISTFDNTITSMTLTGITPGTELRLRMRVQNVVGYSSYSDILSIVFAEVPAAPDAPVFVSRSGDTADGQLPFITVSWEESSDSGGLTILGYKVEITDDITGGVWTAAYEGGNNPDILSWQFEGLIAGTAYNFRVYSRNDKGYSNPSDPTEIYCGTVPHAIPTAPTLGLVTVNTNDADITVNWSTLSAPLNGGSAVLGYYLQINSGFDTDYLTPIVISDPSTLTYTFTGLTQGAEYQIRIAAYNEIFTTNALGSELNYSPALLAIAASPPDKVSSITQKLTELKKGTIVLVWTAPDDNGSPITSYTLQKDNGLGFFYTIYTGLALEYTDFMLTDGGEYNYKVVAANAAGTGIESDTINAIAGEYPSRPLNLRVVTQNSMTIAIEWDAPSDDGGRTISGYTVKVVSSGSTVSTTTTSTSFTRAIAQDSDPLDGIDDSEIGKIFSFQVAATNDLGTGEFTQVLSLIAVNPPLTPTLSLESRGLKSLYLKFTPDTSSTSAAAVVGYQLYRNEGISGSPFKLIADVKAGQVLYNATTLVTGREYTFRLYAYYNSDLKSAYTEQSWIVGVVPGKANAPYLSGSSRGTDLGGGVYTPNTGTIKIKWNALATVSGLPITKYVAYHLQQDLTEIAKADITDLTTLEIEFTGLTEGGEYAFKVIAWNIIGQGQESNVVFFAAADTPGQPDAPLFETSTDTSISIAWSSPTNNGGSPITGYKVYMDDFRSDELVLIYDGSSAPSVLSFTKTGLNKGQEYGFAVTALNRVGEGIASVYGTFYCDFIPGVPGTPQLISSSTSQVSFGWTPPPDTNGGVFDQYEIWHKQATEPETAWTKIATTAINILEYEHTGLSTVSEDVQYKIKAISTDRTEGNEGNFSSRSTFILASVPTAPNQPTITQTTRTSVTINWEPNGDGGSNIIGYKLYRYNKAIGGEDLAYDGSTNAVVTSFLDSNLSAGIYYGYRAVAINRVGTSSLSNEIVALTGEMPGQPPAPIYVSSTSTTITLKLTRVTDNGGLPITSYHLYRNNGTLESSNTEITSYDSELTYTVSQADETDMVTGSTYRFYYLAKNDKGEGEASNISSFALGALPSDPISAPTLSRDLSTTTSLYVSWENYLIDFPTQDLDIEGYGLYLSGSGEETDFTLIYDGFNQPNVLTYNVTGLTTGSRYSFYFLAKNFNGYSGSSPESRWLVCLAPSGLDPPLFVSATKTTINLRWTPAKSDGGCPITSYDLEMYDSGTSTYIPVTPFTSGAYEKIEPYVTSYTVTGLTDVDTAHIFKLKTTNAIGTIESTTISVILAAVPNTPTVAPTQSKAAAGKTQIGVKLTAVDESIGADENGGSQILGYQIHRDNGLGGSFSALYNNTNVLATSYLDTGLVNGRTYRYKYRVRNINGWSDFSPIGYLVAASKPGKPSIPTLVDVNSSIFTIRLLSPSDTGGSKIFRYEIFIDEGAINSGFRSVGTFTGSSGTHIFSASDTTLTPQLEPGKLYRVRWAVENEIDSSEVSEALRLGFDSQAETPTNLALDINNSGPGKISLTWNAASAGNLPILGYTLQMRDNEFISNFYTVYDGSSAPSTTSYAVSNLTPGSFYQFRVYSHNFNGMSEASSYTGAYA
jgi:large repetitive protein